MKWLVFETNHIDESWYYYEVNELELGVEYCLKSENLNISLFVMCEENIMPLI